MTKSALFYIKTVDYTVMVKFIKDTIYDLHTGYCMQETHFYQVVGFTKSGKSAIIRRLQRYYDNTKPGFVFAYKNDFDPERRAITVRITLDSEGAEMIRVGYQDYLWAKHPWNGEAGSRDYSINFETKYDQHRN